MRVVVVDDERLARARLRRFCAELPGVDVVGEAADGRAAVETVRRTRPDLLLLDIRMPGLDGFAVLEALGAEAPAVVFVTAHDDHAVRAFDAHAVDYVLKPVRAERLGQAIARARDRSAGVADRVAALLADLRPARHLERVLVEDGERAYFVRLKEVTRIESDRNYVVLHDARGAHRVRGQLTALLERLDPARWVRVNRSTIVHIDAIQLVEPWFHGEHHLTLRDGARVVWSRRFRERAAEILARGF